jgi:hypothetical protein
MKSGNQFLFQKILGLFYIQNLFKNKNEIFINYLKFHPLANSKIE